MHWVQDVKLIAHYKQSLNRTTQQFESVEFDYGKAIVAFTNFYFNYWVFILQIGFDLLLFLKINYSKWFNIKNKVYILL